MAFLRVAFGLSYLLLLTPYDFLYLLKIPEYLYFPSPGSIAYYLFDQMPAHWVIVSAHYLCITCVALIVVGRWTVPACLVLSLVLTLIFSVKYSFGKIDHNWLNVVLPAILAFAWTSDERSRRSQWLVNLCLLGYFFGMFSAGIPKLLDPTWLGFDEQVTRDHTIRHHSPITPLIDSLGSPLALVIWETLDWMGVLFEVGFSLLAVVRRRFILPFLVCACGFHLVNHVLLNIRHHGLLGMYLVYGFLCAAKLWPKLIQRLTAVEISPALRWLVFAVAWIYGVRIQWRGASALFDLIHLALAALFFLTWRKRPDFSRQAFP
jgi:hypothetical protein